MLLEPDRPYSYLHSGYILITYQTKYERIGGMYVPNDEYDRANYIAN